MARKKKIEEAEVPSMLTLAEKEYEVPEKQDGKPVKCSGTAYSGGSFSQWWSSMPCYVDLAGMKLAEQIPLMYNHIYDPECRLGVVSVENNGKTLAFDGEFDEGNELAQGIIRAGKKFAWQVSIGAENSKYERISENTTATVNGQTVNGPALIIKESILREISIVAIGADAKTSMEIKASLMAPEEPENEPEQAQEKTDTAPEKIELTEENSVNIQASEAENENVTKAEEVSAENTEPTDNQSDTNTEEEITMNEELNAKLDAITEGITKLSARMDEAEKKMEVQASRPAPEINVNASEATDGEVLKCAVEQAMGIKQEDSKAAEVAEKQYKGQMGLRQLYTECAHKAGFTGYVGNSNMADAVNAIKANFSNISLPGILSNAINKRIKAGWDYAEDAWRKVAEITSVSDYKAFSTYTLNAKGEYEEVPNGGTIPSGELAESSYENQVKRYGLMFSIDEMDIVNDDLGAINQRAFAFGRKAALKLNKVLWTKFQNDSDFFKADNHNIVTSAGELNVENLGKLVKAFRKQTDANGDILGYEPAILLVPSNLEPVALKLFNDAEIRDNTASKIYTTGNPWRNRFVPVASAYLTSDDDYYLLADPNIAATMQVAFLNGQQAPLVESNPTSFDTFGISYRGKFSFGVAFADPKAGVKGDKA